MWNKKISLIVGVVLASVFMVSCKQENSEYGVSYVIEDDVEEIEIKEEITSSNVTSTEYDKEIYSSEFVTIVCDSIYSDKIEFSVTSKMKNNNLEVMVDRVALDGLVPPEYYGEESWIDIEPGRTEKVYFYGNMNYTEHKLMTACFEVFNDEGTGVESIDVVDFDLGMSENIEYEEPDGILVFDSETLGITYIGADDTGIRLRVNNKHDKAVTVSFDRPFSINGKSYDEVVSVRTIPAHSISDYYFYVKNFEPDYLPEDVKQFECSGCTFINTTLETFAISSAKEVDAIEDESVSDLNEQSEEEY